MSAAISLQTPDFYTWGFWAAPVRVHLSLEVVTTIRRQLESSGKTGYGLLTGVSKTPGVTTILDSFSLQTLDAPSVDAARRIASGELVGFYRTTQVGSNWMSEGDRVLAASSFGNPSSVFLLIETTASGIGDARFCFWSEGELFDWPVMMFPFSKAQLASKEWQTRARESGDAPELAPVAAMPDAAPQLRPATDSASLHTMRHPMRQLLEFVASGTLARWRQASGRHRAGQVFAAVTAASLLLFSGAWIYFGSGSNRTVASQPARSRAAVQTLLGLAVERRGPEMLVSWNSRNPTIAKADYGVLLVRGSEVRRDVPLTAAELRAGGVVYPAPAEQVQFQLDVVAGELLSRESLTVAPEGTAASASSVPVPVAELRQFKLVQSSVPAAVSLPRSLEPPAAVAAIPSSGGTPALPVAVPERRPAPALNATNAPAPTRARRRFKQVPAGVPGATAPAHLGEPPAVSGGGAVAESGGTLALLSQTPVSPPAPVVHPPAKEIPRGATHPPVAIHQELPDVPIQLKLGLLKPAAVDVRVSVDASGRVIKADAPRQVGVHPFLRDAAVQAARRWQFRPAEANGRPVEGEAFLRFNFAPSR